VSGVGLDCSACRGIRGGTSVESTDMDAVTSSLVPELDTVVSRVWTDRPKVRGTGVITRFGGGIRAGIAETELG
jgi:hypothetical protein